MNKKVFHITLTVIKKIWGIDKAWIIITFIQNLFVSISGAISTALLVQVVYKGIIGLYSIKKVILLSIAIGLFVFITGILNSVYYGKFDTKSKKIICSAYAKHLALESANVQLKEFYNEEFLNNQYFLTNNLETPTTGFIVYLAQYISNIISIIICLLIGSYINWAIVLASLLFMPVIYITSMNSQKTKLEVFKRLDENNRKKSIYRDYFFKKQYTEELRLYSLQDSLNKRFVSSADESIRTIKSSSFKTIGLLSVKSILLDVIIYFGLLFYLAYRVINYELTIDIMFPATVIAYQLITRLNTVLQIFPKLQEIEIYSEKYNEYIEYCSRKSYKEIQNKINSNNFYDNIFEFKNVTFKYHEYDKKETLTNINFEIKKNEKIAIVGKNGAGKSTLVKLIMGLYNDYEGEIKYKGRDIKCLSLKEYRDMFACAFQDSNYYAISICENIAMDELDNIDIEHVKYALDQAGFLEEVNTFPKGIYTNLTREFDNEGVALSGGQYQKIIMARIFYKNSPVIILDEPSSALDPISEYHFFKRLNDYSKDKTSIMITHRLFTIKEADRIVCLDDGKLAEIGTHEELMKKGGIYATMFNLQSNKYNFGRVL